MYHSSLEYIVGNSYSIINYFSKNIDDNYGFDRHESTIFKTQYRGQTYSFQYNKNQQYEQITYATNHSFTPEIFLNPLRPKSRFVDDNNEARRIAEAVFELIRKEKLPNSISINVLPFEEFKTLHSRFGSWHNGILGFSINGYKKLIFVRENNLDALILIIGHEIGHVLTETLPNKHDEEAKAFAFSIEWAKTIKQHNVASLGLSIKDNFAQPARNGLHDVAFSFVDFMVRRGRKAMQLHNDLAKRYVSIFDRVY
jgi:hypothetical protein